MDFTSTAQLAYQQTLGTGPVAPVDAVSGQYVAASEGVIDFGSGAATGVSQSVPFGSVGAARSVVLKHAGTTGSYNVSLNGGGVTGSFELPPGGRFDYAVPVSPSGRPLTAVAVAVAASQPGLGQVRYVILGE